MPVHANNSAIQRLKGQRLSSSCLHEVTDCGRVSDGLFRSPSETRLGLSTCPPPRLVSVTRRCSSYPLHAVVYPAVQLRLVWHR